MSWLIFERIIPACLFTQIVPVQYFRSLLNPTGQQQNDQDQQNQA
jgi:hypothetical protein